MPPFLRGKSTITTLVKVVSISVFLLMACGEGTPTGIPTIWSWPEGTPASQGLDETLLGDLTTQLKAGDLGPVSSILVVRNGVLAYEEYSGDKGPEDTHPLYSVTKSVGSVLVGIAWDQGLIGDVRTPVLDFFPEYSQIENDGEWKQAMTVEDVLQMRSGLEWDEWDEETHDWSGQALQFWNSRDWVKYMLDRPMTASPGSEWLYNTGSSNLLSGILGNVAGTTAREFSEANLFDPMDIKIGYWSEGPNGTTNFGNGLSLRSRDLAKFGYLILEDGLWRPTNEQLVSREWLEATFQRHTQMGYGGYGYQWWIYVMGQAGTNVNFPCARGYGGQSLFLVEPLNMVVVITGEFYNGERDTTREILYDFLLPAADSDFGWPIIGGGNPGGDPG